MKKVGLVIVLGFALWFGSRFLGDDHAKIQKLLQNAAKTASINQEVQIFQVQTRAQELAKLTSEDFTGEIKTAGGESHVIPQRDELIKQLAQVFYVLKPYIVELSEISISPPSNTATATAIANLKVSPEKEPFERVGFTFELVKSGGNWRIEKAQVQVLQK